MKEQININDIESVEKQKTLLVSNAIKITTKDGKKVIITLSFLICSCFSIGNKIKGQEIKYSVDF